MGRAVEELLYPAMEDFQLDIVLGRGPTARSIRLDLPRFTLVGATTRTGLVTGPLRDRFGIVARLELYSDAELEAIVRRTSALLGVELTPEGATEIARRSRGTPRLAIRLLRRVRDFVEVRGEGVDHRGGGARRPDDLRGRRARPRRPRPEDPRDALHPFRRPTGGPVDAGGERRRGTRDRRGRLRAVPAAGRARHAHAAGHGSPRRAPTTISASRSPPSCRSRSRPVSSTSRRRHRAQRGPWRAAAQDPLFAAASDEGACTKEPESGD